VTTPIGRSGREAAAFSGVYYPGSETLVNKLGIREERQLSVAERQFTDRRMSQGLPANAQALTYEGFKAIHHHLFQDLYDWAGQERAYTTGRGPAPFAPPEQITPWMEKQMESLSAQNFLRGLEPARFCAQAAELVNEINAAHPFIEGNGRVQRIWLRQVAQQAGYKLEFAEQDKSLWYEASRIGFEQADNKPMARLLQTNLSRLPDLQRQVPASKRSRGRDDNRGPER